MILGIDAGTSAVKLAVLDGEQVMLTHYQRNAGDSIQTLHRALEASHALDLPVDGAAVTGLNSEHCGLEALHLPWKTVSELDAIGCGGSFLSGCPRALMVNMGTGTTFVLAEDGHYTHLGGTGIGGGTLAGLSHKVLGLHSPEALFDLSASGDMSQVDLRIGDLFSGSDTLDPSLTASNLAKHSPNATDADWAAGLVNLVLECVGTMATLACGSREVDTVVLLGALTQQQAARERFELFSRLYHPNYIIAPHAACATAVGAALLVQEEEFL